MVLWSFDKDEHAAELAELAASGQRLREQLRDVVHGTLDRTQYDKSAGRAWMDRANDHRLRLAKQAAGADYAGWNAVEQSELIHTGRRAPAVLIAVEDTGMTVNNSPRIRVRLRVEPGDEQPFEVERKVVVSRVAIPRAGERVEVVYDPDDRHRFTFRMADLSDDAAVAAAAPPDRVEQLVKLGELRDSGVLSEEEFEAEKRRILGGA